jgi:hypothetical protein
MTWIDSTRRQRELDAVQKYEPVSPRTDPRCFLREMLEELLDALRRGYFGKWKLK